MKSIVHMALFVCLVAMTVTGSIGRHAATAQVFHTRPLPFIRGSTPRPVATPRGPEHDVFGTIVHLQTSTFAMRMRSGRILDVDASTAIESGRFSAPLFVGKFVLVSGKAGARGILFADTVTRMPRIDAAMPSDK